MKFGSYKLVSIKKKSDFFIIVICNKNNKILHKVGFYKINNLDDAIIFYKKRILFTYIKYDLYFNSTDKIIIKFLNSLTKIF